MNNQINLMDVVGMILKRWWIVAVSTVLLGAIFFTVSEYFIPEKYTSNGKLLVSNTVNTVSEDGSVAAESINTLNASARLLSTYIEIFKTDSFLSKIAADSGTKYTVGQIKGMVTYTSLNQTEVLQVSVLCQDKIDARQICELILDNAQSEVERIGSGGSVTIVDEASSPTTPTSPNKTLNSIIGVLLGIILGVLIIFVIEFFDIRIKTEDDLVSKFDLPILGVIPDLESSLVKGGK